jgi:Neprosin
MKRARIPRILPGTVPLGGFHLFRIRLRQLSTAAAATALVAGALTALPAQASAATGTADVFTTSATTFVPFNTFIQATATAGYSQAAAVKGTALKADAQAFSQMQDYILAHYRGVQVEHSFVLGSAYYDCAVTATQPSVRDLGVSHVAVPPAAVQTAVPVGEHLASQVAPGSKDAFGNKQACPSGTIPIRRMTLPDVTQFTSLSAYLAKQPAGAGDPTIDPGTAHRYAVGYQSVANTGSNSWLDLWNNTGDFDLSQIWDVSEASTVQTLEAGWIHYPAKFNTNNSVLFIFWTPNNYASGCYDLDCSGFVQTNSSVYLGAAFSTYSTLGGSQYGFGLQYQWYQGNWWLYFSGTAIGYYPGGIYSGGPLNSGSANMVEYGGEAYTAGTNWPQMGSGDWNTAGFGYAAYQNDIFYIDTTGAGQSSSLNPIVTNPACYNETIVPASQGGSWGSYIWFGGPGGTC